MTCDHEAQIRDLLEEREELLTVIRRLLMGNHPAGRALRVQRTDEPWRGEVTWGRTGEVIEIDATDALRKALEARDAEHEGGAT